MMKPSDLLQLIQDYADAWYALGQEDAVDDGSEKRMQINHEIAELWQQIRKGVRGELLTGPTFEHAFFRKAPAMASLQKEQSPSPGHVRACLLELARYMLRGTSTPGGES